MKLSNRKRPCNKQAGLTLVELLISMGLGLFLVWGAMQSYLSSKQTYSIQQGLSRIQETGRTAYEFIGYDIRNAGNLGCSSNTLQQNATTGDGCLSGVNMLNNNTTAEYDFGKAIFAVDNVNGSATAGLVFNAGNLSPAPKKDTDLLIVRGGTASGVTLTDSNTSATNMPVTVISNDGGGCYSGLCQNDIIAVTDCVKAKIMQATALPSSGTEISHMGGANACTNWGSSLAFGKGSQILKMNTSFYYVANNAAGVPTLYRRGMAAGAATELLAGVEDMQVEIGIGENKGTGAGYILKEYKKANVVLANEWDAWDGDAFAVVSVRYSLLVRNEENTLEEPQTYTFNGQPYVGGVAGTVKTAASDRRLRQIFTNTVGIRNRLR